MWIFLEKDLIISMNYFKRDFQEFWPQINKYYTEHMSYRTVIFEQNYHWLLVELFFSRSLYALDC